MLKRSLVALHVCLAVFLMDSVHAQETGRDLGKQEPAAGALSPILGVWTFVLPDGKCSEVFSYNAAGVRLSTSGEEVTESDYEIESAPSENGFYKTSEILLSSNGKKDCWGDSHDAFDEKVQHFIQFSPTKDKFLVCQTESLQACVGPFRKDMPEPVKADQLPLK